MDKGSVGRPSMPHCALSAGLDSTSSGMTPAVMGISRSIMSGSHFSSTRKSRNLALNGPVCRVRHVCHRDPFRSRSEVL